MNVQSFLKLLGSALLISSLAGCSSSFSIAPSPFASSPPSADASPSAISPSPSKDSSDQAEEIAKVAEIRKQPVFVRSPNVIQEQAALTGMGLKIGDRIRTQGQALAQVDLNNGLAFRIGGDAVLTLQPDNRLNLAAGDMITWVQPGKKLPTEIITPVAIAGIRGTTVYVKIPPNPQDGILFFAWEGLVSVRLPNQAEEVFLKTGEEVRIKPGERDIRAIKRRVRRLARAEWRQKRQNDRLLRSFKTPMSTLPIIEQVKPGQVSLNHP